MLDTFPEVPISDQLRKAIKNSGLSSRDLAEATKVDHTSIARFLGKKRSLTLDAVDKLCEYFGLALTDEPAKPARKRRKTT